MRSVLRLFLATCMLIGVVLIAPASVAAAEPTFGTPTAAASLGDPLVVTSTIDGVEGGSVQLMVRLAGYRPEVVIAAHPGAVAGVWEASAPIDVASSIQCSCYFEGQNAPNTNIEYQFRVRAADGTTTLGPVGQVTVTDDRFTWQTLEQDLVRVHWYEGDQAFAQASAGVANDAIDQAAALLGSTLPEPVDLFVYATQDALLEAVSPGRENIAGEAHSDIATLFVWIPPIQDPDESAVTVAHEMTHLVFNETTDNPYNTPARWLNEGVAVYLSEGYSPQFQGVVSGATSSRTLIPLQGLAGFFPSPYDQFFLAYGEAVAGVDYFVRTFGEQKLWDLVRSYSEGKSDDDAFTATTGSDMAAFNAAWMASLNYEVPDPIGPQPAPPGPVPGDWTGQVQPTGAPGSPGAASPGATLRPGETAVPGRTTTPASPTPGQPSSSGSGSAVALGVGVGVIVLLAVIGLVVFVQRGRKPPSYE